MKTIIEETIGIIPLLNGEELKKFMGSLPETQRWSIKDALRESIEESQAILKKLEELK